MKCDQFLKRTSYEHLKLVNTYSVNQPFNGLARQLSRITYSLRVFENPCLAIWLVFGNKNLPSILFGSWFSWSHYVGLWYNADERIPARLTSLRSFVSSSSCAFPHHDIHNLISQTLLQAWIYICTKSWVICHPGPFRSCTAITVLPILVPYISRAWTLGKLRLYNCVTPQGPWKQHIIWCMFYVPSWEPTTMFTMSCLYYMSSRYRPE